MYVVILAGGSGTRFWPLSRVRTPKQLMSVFGGRSMLQRTVERVLPLSPKRIMVVTNALQANETERQLAGVADCPVDIIQEPVGRNTAPAIALAAAIIARHDPAATMVVLPADHYIRNENEFCRVVRAACRAASKGDLVTLGIEPTSPETGYGYIESETVSVVEGISKVKRFVEKPNLERAVEFLAKGNFYWNSGMFIWQVSAIRKALKAEMPSLEEAVASLFFGADAWDYQTLNPQIERLYPSIQGESIDFGVMERAKNVLVIPAAFGWSDVGSWSALPEVIDPDEDGNVTINAAGLVSIDSSGSLVYADGKLAALVGVDNMIVVATPDAVMVCRKDRAQDVKKVVEILQQKGLTDYL